MADLRRRIKRLEQRLAQAQAGRDMSERAQEERRRQRALSEVWDVLELHYPGELRAFEARLLDASVRVQAGTPDAVDLVALAALPRDALNVLGWSREDALVLIGAVHDDTMTLDRWKALPIRGPGAGGAPDLSDEQLIAELHRLGLHERAEALTAS